MLGLGTGPSSFCALPPIAPSPRSPLTEVKSGHHCLQLGALQEQLRLLEEENHQLREVRMGKRVHLRAGRCSLPCPFLSSSLQASHLDALEEEEQMLILDCVEQFCT